MRWTYAPKARLALALTVSAALSACGGGTSPAMNQPTAPFDTDLAFLRQHAETVVLSAAAGAARVAVAPAYQGRVMTSTTGGPGSPSFGWIGRAAIESGARQPHMNVFGGEDRFWLGPEGGQYALFFKADGQYRAKIGLPPSRALGVAGSYDAGGRVLTLVHYTRPAGASQYVNSMWEMQREPYQGDAINSYNDGPVAPGKPPLGPFYELETSSPALALAPGEKYTHVHRTIHLSGSEADLERIARATLRVGLADIAGAFGSN